MLNILFFIFLFLFKEVCFAGNNQPTDLVSELGSKKEFWTENLKTKQRIR
jgi:hypothetical protein